jgi:hypothetical protein
LNLLEAALSEGASKNLSFFRGLTHPGYQETALSEGVTSVFRLGANQNLEMHIVQPSSPFRPPLPVIQVAFQAIRGEIRET